MKTPMFVLLCVWAIAVNAHAGSDSYILGGAISGAGQALQQGAASIQNGLIQQHLMQEQHRLEMERIEAQERRARERNAEDRRQFYQQLVAEQQAEEAKKKENEAALKREAEERLREAEQRAAKDPTDLNIGLVAYRRGDYATALARLQIAAEPSRPSLAEFLAAFRSANPSFKASTEDLTRYWQLTYGRGGLADMDARTAQFYLGLMYSDGQGVPQNYSQAFRWYMKAAIAGDASAQNNVGFQYSKGLGVPQDYVQAHQWYNLAAVSGDDMAVKNRDALAKRMTPAQIAEAQKLAGELQAKLDADARRQDAHATSQEGDAEARMTALRPDWKEIVGPDPTTGAAPTPYRQWLARQPAEYRNLIENTTDPNILAKAIDQFKAQTVAGK